MIRNIPLINSDGAPDRGDRSYTVSTEYALLATLVVEQYQPGGVVHWEKLLALPFGERLPSLIARDGKQAVDALVFNALKSFIASTEFPAYKCPTQTAVRVAACEILLSAKEDYLALEDLVLFFQRAKAGVYGPVKTLVTLLPLMHQLDAYRQERHDAYTNWKMRQDAAFRQMGPVERSAPEPTQLGDLFAQALVIDMNKKMSG
ncbi:MAG: hypothetical protein EOO08_04340 [Chitinophagaceae bacterium]|nr:MAG: hypothetical protein EOO08_04340 [Chitinophagaceae bacterium]